MNRQMGHYNVKGNKNQKVKLTLFISECNAFTFSRQVPVLVRVDQHVDTLLCSLHFLG